MNDDRQARLPRDGPTGRTRFSSFIVAAFAMIVGLSNVKERSASCLQRRGFPAIVPEKPLGLGRNSHYSGTTENLHDLYQSVSLTARCAPRNPLS
jgi:hypothetical protein